MTSEENPLERAAHRRDARALALLDEMRRDAPAVADIEQALATAVISNSDDAIVAKSVDGIILSWNRGAERIFGYCADEMVGQPITLLFPSERLHEEDRLISMIQAGEIVSHFETQRVRKDGTLVDVSVTLSAVRDQHGRIFAVSKIARDISERLRAERALAQQSELLAVTLGSIADAVITANLGGNIDWMNPAAERMTGWRLGEARGRAVPQVFHVVHEDSREAAPNPVAACLAGRKVVGMASHSVLIARDGKEFGIEDSAAPICNAHGEMLGVVLVFHDVTEQRRLAGEMSYKATHDGLTGLLNRTEFETRLRRTLLGAHEDGSQHAVLYVDLDEFKLVNDACGHAVGDQLLQQVSRILAETLRTRDTLARLGGDEFGAILEHCTTDKALRVAQKICEQMEEFRFVHDRRSFRIGASIGLVPLDRRWPTPASIMQAADTACYAAKEAGRNRVHVWFDTDLAMRDRHGEIQWAERIGRALDEDRLLLYFQQIVPVAPGHQGLHAEVLARIRGEDGEIVTPGAFLPAAERFHLATRIDRRVLKLATQWLCTQADLESIEMLCINVSGQSIGDRAFHRHTIDLFRALPPGVLQRICLEITETAVVTNLADASLFIEQIRALGVKTALDDFGAGASSFGYLKSLTVDILKIDGQYIQGVLDSPLDRAAVRCFVEVASMTGVLTVAEFVDSTAILQEIRALGVDFAQGFLLHRPEPLEQASALFTRA
ncbi:MAG: EAL domain-containing protein [Pseudomonadota bacterium]|nr:EAL domain-containing protein [Pseudomonadota bacterium]